MKNATPDRAIDFRKSKRAKDYEAHREWFERKHPYELKRKPYDGR
jgi:hypothetical protein